MKKLSSIIFLLLSFLNSPISAKQNPDNKSSSYLLKPKSVFDGEKMQKNWVVVVEGNLITYAGPSSKLPKLPKQAKTIELPSSTLLPGLIEGHSHVLLHPYNETGWNDQVLKESKAERVARATNHLRDNLMAGFTTLRDLGSEGAGYADVGLRTAIEKKVIVGPRLLVAGPALVATGSYGPKGFHSGVHVPLGAEEADGFDDLLKATRRQIGGGVDIVKVYADYRWGPNRTAQPTFSVEELKLIVETAASSGRKVVAHASTAEAMKRAVLAGVSTIEHGDGGTKEVFELMKQYNVALCPTIAAGEAISAYRGWVKGQGSTPERIVNKKRSVRLALETGVKIISGGDVGVFPHGDNVRELELMVDYGMKNMDVLKITTSGNADIMGLKNLGRVRKGGLADIIAVTGDPSNDISVLRNVSFVMKDGEIFKQQ